MARILHTADVHLAADHPERRAALEELLDLAETEDADLVTVGGDLFDSDRDSDELRPKLREPFSERPYDVLTIPGNHDEAAFRTDLNFGESFEAAVTEPFEHVEHRDVRLTCVPYTADSVEDVLLSLVEREPYAGTEAVLLHCSLEAPFADASTGDEAGRQYFPVTREALADLDFDYYLAGHFHSAHRVELPNDGTFVYPGTPASVTRSETGPRTVVLLDTEADAIELRRLDAFHYDSLEVTVTPGEEEAVLAEIAAWVDEREDRNVEASISVDGHVGVDETAFQADLDDACGDVTPTNETTGVRQVLDHPLFREFEAKLDDRSFEDESLEEDVWNRTVRIFSELSTGGRLS